MPLKKSIMQIILVTRTNYHNLITGVSVTKRLSLYVFALWGRYLVTVVRIREGPYRRLSVI